jgi:O-antigen ligase/tetratricopeptide (TPR) repeat protein
MLLGLGALTAGWFAWRAWISPVAELAEADLLLLCCAVGAFISVRGISGHGAAEKTLIWGIALLMGGCIWAMAMQVADPSFNPLFGSRVAAKMVTGFFSHYNYAANFMLAASLVLAAAGMMGRHAALTRALFLLLAAAGLTGVYLTQSRGGILGAAVGCGMFAVAALILAKRRDSRWFPPAVIATPLIGAAVIAFLMFGWEQRSGGDTHRLLDNDIRLYLLGVAVSCVAQHPLHGGGSRSFSWECNQFFDNQNQRQGGARPEMVHNEFMQAATDYGMIGAGLLALLVLVMMLAAVLRMLFEDRPREHDARDAWRLGGFAALAGILTQSSFSFVFHLMPGVFLLGISLGMMSRPGTGLRPGRGLGARLLLTLAALGCAVMLLPAGWKGSRVTAILWPTYFSKQPETAAEARIDALTEAIGIWPMSEFYQDRAQVFQEQAIEKAGGPAFREWAELAAFDYAEGVRLHPREPGLAVNLGNLLSQLERDAEAEQAYDRAILLQGGMEPAYRSHFSLAQHHQRKGLRLFDADETEAAQAELELAAQEIEAAVGKMHWVIGDMWEPRVSIHEALGAAREANGDREGALESYHFAAELRDGRRAHYRAAVLIGTMAVEAWSQRQPSQALAKFIEARRRAGMAHNDLPAGISPSDRDEYIAYLDRSIAFLKGAKVEPAE